MKLLEITKDGGPESTVWAHWLFEVKKLCSVVLLRFENGSRDAYHSHAFNCVSWVLRGRLDEALAGGKHRTHLPSFRPVVTRREDFHQVVSTGRTWVLSFRGPWADTWFERVGGRVQKLTHGRRVVS